MDSLVPVSIFYVSFSLVVLGNLFCQCNRQCIHILDFFESICQHTILYLVTGYLCHAWCNCYRYIWNEMGIFLHLIVFYKLRASGVVWLMFHRVTSEVFVASCIALLHMHSPLYASSEGESLKRKCFKWLSHAWICNREWELLMRCLDLLNTHMHRYMSNCSTSDLLHCERNSI